MTKKKLDNRETKRRHDRLEEKRILSQAYETPNNLHLVSSKQNYAKTSHIPTINRPSLVRLVEGSCNSDITADRIEDWWIARKHLYPNIRTIMIDLDVDKRSVCIEPVTLISTVTLVLQFPQPVFEDI